MPNDTVVEGLNNAFDEAIKLIQVRKRGVVGTLYWLTNETATFTRHSRNKELRKFYFVLDSYYRITQPSLGEYLIKNYGERLLDPDPWSDLNNPNERDKLEIRAQLRWLSWNRDELLDFFGSQTRDFYDQRAKKALVPEHMDEDSFPIFRQIILESYETSSKMVEKFVLEMLQNVREKLETTQNFAEATEVLWEHLLDLHQDAIPSWCPTTNQA